MTDDAYPDPADPVAHVPAALNYGLMRSLKGGQPWLLLEQAASAVSWRDVNVPKAPGRMRIDSLQAIAHGSDGAMFFQWRQAKYGQEKFHSAMLGHRGEASRSFQETKALGAELQRLAPVRGTAFARRVALVVDWDSLVGRRRRPSRCRRSDWTGSRRRAPGTRPSTRSGTPSTPCAPPARSTATTSSSFRTSTSRMPRRPQRSPRSSPVGGQLVVGPFSGVVDATEKVHDGGAPGPLRDLLGVEVDEHWPIPDGRTERVELLPVGRVASASERIETSATEGLDTACAPTRPAGARLLDRRLERVARAARGHRGARSLRSGELAGRAAATRRPRADGDGAAWYLERRARARRDDRPAPRGARLGRTPGRDAHRLRPRGRDAQRRRHRLHVRAQPRPRRAHGRRSRTAPRTCSPAPAPPVGSCWTGSAPPCSRRHAPRRRPSSPCPTPPTEAP